MRIFIVISLLGFAFLTLSPALAEEPAEIWTAQCRGFQLIIQDTIKNTLETEGDYKNHGQLVKAVVHLVKSAKKEKQITGNCAACILVQFALSIPIEDQDACGPDMETSNTMATVACCLAGGSCEDMTPEDCDSERGIPMDFGSNCEDDGYYCNSSY